MLSKSDIKTLERRYGFSPQKRLGQNFLIDVNVRDKLIARAELSKEDTLLEIGSGLGQLTFELSKIVKKIVAVEFDKKLFSILSDFASNYSNIVLVHEDFLKFNIKDFIPKNKKIKVISNLPYCIASPVILKLCLHNEYISYAILTLQKEVAERLVAKPCSKEYSSLTLFAEFHSEVKRLFNISKNSFYPVPKVDSTVIFLKMRGSSPVKVPDKKELFVLIRAGFSTRRKTLLNALASRHYKGFSKEQLENILKSCGMPDNVRAEALTLPDFTRILNTIYDGKLTFS